MACNQDISFIQEPGSRHDKTRTRSVSNVKEEATLTTQRTQVKETLEKLSAGVVPTI